MALLLAGCVLAMPITSARAEASLDTNRQSWTKTELYFGLEKPGGIRLALQDWVTFVLEVVTPLLKDGFTIVDAYGQ